MKSAKPSLGEVTQKIAMKNCQSVTSQSPVSYHVTVTTWRKMTCGEGLKTVTKRDKLN